MKCGEGKGVGCGGDLVPDSPHQFVCAMYRCADCGTAFCITCLRKHFAASKAKWDVRTEEVVANTFKTIFQVEQQSFDLQEVSVNSCIDRAEAEQSCNFIRDMFLKALERIGVRKGPADT